MEGELADEDDAGCRQHDPVGNDAPLDVDRRQDDQDAREDRRDERFSAETELEKADGRDEADARRGPGPVAG